MTIEINKIKFDSVDTPEKTDNTNFEGKIKFDAKQRQKHPNGYLIVDAYIAKVGIVSRFEDGIQKDEFVSEEELFKQDSLDTLDLVPITENHPVDNAKRVLVSSNNDTYHSRGIVVGSTEKVIENGEIFLKAKLVIKDQKTIDKVEAGQLVQVSPGYIAGERIQSGQFKNRDYNIYQTNRRYNHIALVPQGRSGEKVRVKLDSEDGYFYSQNQEINKNNNKEEIRVKMLIDGLEVDLKANEEKIVQKALNDRQNQVTEVTKELDAQKAKFDSLSEQLEAEKEKVKKFDSVDHLENAKQRLKLEQTLKPVMRSSFKFDGLTDVEIKKQALVKMKPEIDLKDKSDDYISARFDSVLETDKAKYDAVEKQADASIQNLGGGVVPPKQKLSIEDEISNILAGVN